MAKSQTPATKTPKFKIGDKVSVDGQKGEVVELGVHDDHWFDNGHEQLYGVRLEPWERVVVDKIFRFKGPTGELRDHESDTLGAVPESTIKKGG